MKILLIVLLLALAAPAQSKITWGCKIREATDTVSDTVTLDCQSKDQKEAFVLAIPKTEWPKEWSLPGQREFYYGTVKDGKHVAVSTKPTHCDTEFDASGSRNQDQMCGIMFPKDRELIVK